MQLIPGCSKNSRCEARMDRHRVGQRDREIHEHASFPAQKSANKIGGLLIVMPAKAGIQIRDFSGFRVALAIASLPGMTDELCSELLGQDTRVGSPGVSRPSRSPRLR